MFTIHGISISSNTTKVVYVAEALGIDYDYVQMNVAEQEHKTVAHFKRHPLGKLPTLTHDGETLFESNAICAYLASTENSHLYPLESKIGRARIDQWMYFFTNHLGRWLNTYAFEKVAKVKYGFGTPNPDVLKEAFGFMNDQLPCVDAQLDKLGYLASDTMTIADYIAFSHFEMGEMAELSLAELPAIQVWYDRIKSSKEIARARVKMGLT